MLYASFPFACDQHLVKERTRDGELVSHCGLRFGHLLPNGTVEKDMSEIDYRRICERCKTALAASGGTLAPYSKVWKSV